MSRTTSKCVAVTGATGFIGTALCRALHGAGYRVRVLARSRQRAHVLGALVDELVQGDLDDTAALHRLVNGAFAVAHCAGAVRGARQSDFDRVNVQGLANLVTAISAAGQAEPARLLSLSSLAAREPALSFYANSKYRGEQILVERAGQVQWIALRPPAVYGPGDRELLPLFRLMAKGFAPVFGPRDARFSMVYVDDIASLVLAWLQHDAPAPGVYAFADGRPGGYSWDDVIDTVAGLCRRPVRAFRVPAPVLDLAARINRGLAGWFGYAPMLTPEKLRELRHSDWVCDNQAIQQALDWRPRYQLEEGLVNTPGWCRRF